MEATTTLKMDDRDDMDRYDIHCVEKPRTLFTFVNTKLSRYYNQQLFDWAWQTIVGRRSGDDTFMNQIKSVYVRERSDLSNGVGLSLTATPLFLGTARNILFELMVELKDHENMKLIVNHCEPEFEYTFKLKPQYMQNAE